MNSLKTMTKTVKKYGNSGGVYLPSSWIGGEVEINLISRAANPEKDLPLLLADRMKHIMNILIYGSYARDEQTNESDIDVIIVTDNHMRNMKIPRELKDMRYDIKIMGENEIKEKIIKDVLFRKSIENSKAIFNESFLDELKSIKTNKTMKDRIAFAKSSAVIIKNIFELDGENTSLIYPLIMRIKEMLIIKSIQENNEYSIKLLESSMQRNGISKPDFFKLMSYYRSIRDGKSPKKYKLKENVFNKLLGLLEELIANAEKKEKVRKGTRVYNKADRRS